MWAGLMQMSPGRIVSYKPGSKQTNSWSYKQKFSHTVALSFGGKFYPWRMYLAISGTF